MIPIRYRPRGRHEEREGGTRREGGGLYICISDRRLVNGRATEANLTGRHAARFLVCTYCRVLCLCLCAGIVWQTKIFLSMIPTPTRSNFVLYHYNVISLLKIWIRVQDEAAPTNGRAGQQIAGHISTTAASFRDFLLKPEILRAINDCAFEVCMNNLLISVVLLTKCVPAPVQRYFCIASSTFFSLLPAYCLRTLVNKQYSVV